MSYRYEFATNETVNAVTVVTLETSSTETGSKQFIAVGTTINRGEDLAAKGAVCSFSSFLLSFFVLSLFLQFSGLYLSNADSSQTYIFEIVEVVPNASLAPKRWYKLRLRCRDDAKGPVTAMCGFNGYLVSSMGQKVCGIFLVLPLLVTFFALY
jgi:cleavage and polyadenylation specificity factor subunit 1